VLRDFSRELQVELAIGARQEMDLNSDGRIDKYEAEQLMLKADPSLSQEQLDHEWSTMEKISFAGVSRVPTLLCLSHWVSLTISLTVPPSPCLSLSLLLSLSPCLSHRLSHSLSHRLSHCVSPSLPHRVSHSVSLTVSLVDHKMTGLGVPLS
jgi:hypothetical protein